MSEEVIDLAAEAQKRGKFNLADAIKGRAFPEKSVDVYLDAASALKLEEVNAELQYLSGIGNMKEYDKVNEEAQALKDAIIASKLTFHMRGVGQSRVEEITKDADIKFPEAKVAGVDDAEWVRYYLSALIASNIVKVTDAEGNEDTSTFTPEEIIELRGIMPIDSWEVLIETMQKLTLASSYFEVVTDAGFLPKS
jgi:hypothetical protein